MSPAEASAGTKAEVRARILAGRGRLDPAAQREAAYRLAAHVLTLTDDRTAHTVAAYVSIGNEPRTGPLLDRLSARGIEILLPLLQPDGDLDWASYRPGELRPGRLGLLEPSTPPLGVAAVGDADVIVCPGVAGTLGGVRLGRGGGSYDRALARSSVASLTCLLLYDDEILEALPTEPHDRRVDALVTPNRVIATSAHKRG